MRKLAMTILVCTLSFNSYASFNQELFNEANRLSNNKAGLEKCSIKGNNYCTSLLGEKYYKEKSYESAYRLFKKCSDENIPECDHFIGEMHLEGNGVLQNEDKALKYFEKSVKQGIPSSAFNLGRIYTLKAAHINNIQDDKFSYNITRAYAWLKVAKALGVEELQDSDGKNIKMSSHLEMIKKVMNPNQLTQANSLASNFCASTEGCVQ